MFGKKFDAHIQIGDPKQVSLVREQLQAMGIEYERSKVGGEQWYHPTRFDFRVTKHQWNRLTTRITFALIDGGFL